MSTAMVRKQIYIPRRQDVLIKRLSEIRGVSEAEVIRQAIEREISQELSGVAPEVAAAWEQTLQLVLQRKAAAGSGEPYRWNREELYEERESRWFRNEGEREQ